MRSHALFFFLALYSLFCSAADSDHSKALRTPGRNISFAMPEYPSDALTKGIAGRVLFEFGLNEKGLPKEISIVESEPAGLFNEAVLKAVASWLYFPNLEQPCGIAYDRFRQQIWFEVERGEPRVSVSEVSDLPRTQTFEQINSTKGDDDRLTLINNSGLRIKEGTRVDPVYPRAAIEKSLQGVVVGNFHVRPDGSISEATIAYSAPSGIFDSAVKNAMMQFQLENFDGKPPGRKMTVCMPFIFRLSNSLESANHRRRLEIFIEP